jgi:hypothetical protein
MDPDPGGPKTYGSYRSGSTTLVITNVVEESSGRRVVACLGQVWTNYIHTRLFLVRTDLVVPHLGTETRLRTMDVQLSSFLPASLTNFIVEPGGIKGIRVLA